MSQAFESIKQGLQEAIEHAQTVVGREAPGELLTLIGEAYQVIGILADECGRFDDPQVIKMMDNLAAGKMVHADVLPFRSKQNNPTEGNQVNNGVQGTASRVNQTVEAVESVHRANKR